MNLEPVTIKTLPRERLANILQRSMEDISSIYEDMRKIVQDVKSRGDASLIDSCKEYKEQVSQQDLEVRPEEIEEAYNLLDPNVVDALKEAAKNITAFHQAQMERDMWALEVRPGVMVGRILRPIERVGCYVPGGRASYPSTVLMTVIPARVAGVGLVVVTTPAMEGMRVNPATLVAAHISGCDRIFKVGGPWGIAGLAFGTESMPKVDKIVGPGNKYVTAAKMLVYGVVDIDSPAGPSEALILADDSARPDLVAWDFLSQVEHDPDSAAILVTPSLELAQKVCKKVLDLIKTQARQEIIREALSKHSHVLVASDMDEAIAFTNDYAPEHLEIITHEPFEVLARIRHAGSIFLGPYSPVPVGDYASGTNHVLPTSRCARMFSGLSVDDFIKKPTFQYLNRKGLFSLKDVVTTLARAEGLELHARCVEARFL